MQKERSQLWTKKAVPKATQCLAVGWRRSSCRRSESIMVLIGCTMPTASCWIYRIDGRSVIAMCMSLLSTWRRDKRANPVRLSCVAEMLRPNRGRTIDVIECVQEVSRAEVPLCILPRSQFNPSKREYALLQTVACVLHPPSVEIARVKASCCSNAYWKETRQSCRTSRGQCPSTHTLQTLRQ